MAEPILAVLRAQPGVAWAEAAGSLRRGQDTVGDIEIVAPASSPVQALDAVLAETADARCLHRSRGAAVLADRSGAGRRPLSRLPASAEPCCSTRPARQHTSSSCARSPANGAAPRARWAPRGQRRRQVQRDRGRDLRARWTCRGFHPRSVTATRRSQRARSGALPPLVCRAQMRGDLHMHTVYSDGRDTVAAMVDQAPRSAMSTSPSPTTRRIRRPRGTSRPTASSDKPTRSPRCASASRRWPSCTAAKWTSSLTADWTSATASSSSSTSCWRRCTRGSGTRRRSCCKRYMAAVRHPLVNIVTHPSNRLVPHRPGYELDYDRFFAESIATGTALEMDGAPMHLDMDGALARRAVAAGVTVVIDSDCPPRRDARAPDAARPHDGAARLGRGPPRAEHTLAVRGPRLRRRQAIEVSLTPCAAGFPSWPRRSSPPLTAGLYRLDASCRDSTSATPPRSRRWSARRYLTPSDGYPLYLRRRQLVPLAERQRARARDEPGVRAGGGAGLRARRARSRPSSPDRSPAGVAAALLFAARTRSGARRSSPRSTRCTCSSSCWCSCMLLRWAGVPDRRSADAVLRELRARLRQPPLDGSARCPASCSFSARRPAGMEDAPRAARGRDRGCDCGAWARCSTRGTSHGLWHAVTPARPERRARRLLVRRDESRLARLDGAERALGDGCDDRLGCMLFDLRQQFGWAGRPWPPRASLALWRVNRRRAILLGRHLRGHLVFALELQRRRRPRVLPAVAPDAGAARRAGAGLARRAPSRRNDVPWRSCCIAGRLYADYPALDRSDDRRPTELLVGAHRRRRRPSRACC